MPDCIENIIELAAEKCGAADLYYLSTEGRSVVFENNKLKRVTSGQSAGAGLRVIVDGRIGFASTSDLRSPERLVAMAVESAGFGEKARFELPKSDGVFAKHLKTCDPTAASITPEQMVETGREALHLSRERNDDYLFSGGISVSHGLERFLNTEGLDLRCEISHMAAGANIEEVKDGGLLDVYEGKSWGRPFDSMTDITETALEKMEMAATVVKARGGTIPMVFTPKAVENLLSPVMTALNGKMVQKGASILAGKIGEQVVDQQLSIYDDAIVDWAPGSSPFDGEGMATGRLPLIEKGVVKNYLLDLQTAALLGMEPTGSGYRSTSGRPSPGSSNSMVPPGSVPYKDIIADMDYGLIVDQTLGDGQSNTLAGEFSVNVALGFLVEKGQIKGRVKDCMVAGNVYEVLSNIEDVGSEQKWEGSACVPAIRVGGLKPAFEE